MRETGLHIKKPKAEFTYRAAALIIRDHKLLAAKSKDYPCYYTVGGAVEINETSEEAVIREVYEETGLELQVDKLAYVQERFFQNNGQNCHELVFFYTMIIPANIDIAEGRFTDQGPKETLHWLPLNGLREINIVPQFLKTKSFDNITSIEHIISKEK
jgi:8-oxo-dGTP pyrophosphatase MutT (NUDIX family)